MTQYTKIPRDQYLLLYHLTLRHSEAKGSVGPATAALQTATSFNKWPKGKTQGPQRTALKLPGSLTVLPLERSSTSQLFLSSF